MSQTLEAQDASSQPKSVSDYRLGLVERDIIEIRAEVRAELRTAAMERQELFRFVWIGQGAIAMLGLIVVILQIAQLVRLRQ